MNIRSEPVLSVRDLAVTFPTEEGPRKLLHEVSFEVSAGETLAIVGESGSGKSITAMSIMRLIGGGDGACIDGSVRLDGQELLGLSETAMQSVRGNKVAMIFQEPMTSLNPVMTIGAQISETLITHGMADRTSAREQAVALLEKVRIPAAAQRYDDYPSQMSGGMRQRVMIAMALACRPRLLIADEPTTALDVTIQAQILALIKLLQQEEQMGVLFITHDMGVVAEIADRTAVMNQGRIVEAGPTEQIFARPEEGYTRMLLASVPHLGSMAGIATPRRFPDIDPETGTVTSDGRDMPPLDAGGAPILTVKNMVTRFEMRGGLFNRLKGRVHAVENISFNLRAGETLSLVGESGCGKSTSGRSILGLTGVDSGEIWLRGRDLTTLSLEEMRRERRHMQMIYQDPFASLDPRMTVGQAVAEPLQIHRIGNAASRRDKVAGLLQKVGLPEDAAERFPHEFSGGQRQRICIARALALEPDFIVADESVSALDVSVKAQIINLMMDLQESLKLAYLFISHDMAVVERISHRVAIMYLGEIVEIGPREAIFSNPQHPYTRRLLAAVPVPDPARRRKGAALRVDEIPSPVRAPDYVAPDRTYREVAPDHFAQDYGPEWEHAETAQALP
ncbi:MAG: ABC transporter ATP-binding protein [Tropicimonas sp.]|uniref:ABC transporter ATP-binding protein n=1 Tax=Tropicimonas sp. TaxID=2067044 RepID=UPI003A8B9108